MSASMSVLVDNPLFNSLQYDVRPETAELVLDRPPSYRANHGGKLPNESQVPSPTQETRSFTNDVTRSDGSRYSLILNADAALSSQSTPAYSKGSAVNGLLRLHIPPESIHSIKIHIKGTVLSFPYDTFTFLQLSQTLWEKGHPDPNTRSPGASKLSGDYDLPFSISLPSVAHFDDHPGLRNQNTTEFLLPSPFFERHERATIRYEVEAHIHRAKFKSDTKIQMNFGYNPMTKPGPPSPAVQLAYRQDRHLPGPKSDPDGWEKIGSVPITGWAFENYPMIATATLYLCKPLEYTRGAVIPCYMVLRSEDHNVAALDLISSPQAATLRLKRIIKHCSKPELIGKSPDPQIWTERVTHTHSAVWWPSKDYTPEKETFQRHLAGELHLKADMKPTTKMVNFRIEYQAVLYPFDILSYRSREPADTPLLTAPVEIVTAYADGPKPRAYAPPGHDSNNPVGANAYRGP